MKPRLPLLLAALTPTALHAETLVAGWDFFDSATTPTVVQVAADTTASLATSATGGNWGRWNGGGTNSSGASTDGTFGNLSNTVATADTFGAGEGTNSGSNLSLNRGYKPGTITITLTNDSTVDRLMGGFYFDATGRFSQSAKDWTLTYSGAISGTAASGTLTEADMMAATAAQRDWAVDLTGLTDNVWEAGTDAIFTLTFSGGATSTGTGGGQETLVDNIGITVIPPPAQIVKADNNDDLNLGNSWVGGTAPASGELAVWDNTVAGANSTVLGGDVTWGGIAVQDPGGLVTIGSGNTLTLDGPVPAVDLSTASADLTLNADLALEGSEIWTVATGRTVTVGGAASGSKGIDKQGDGTVVLSGSNTYAGATSVTSGILQLGASNVIPNGFGAGNVSVAVTLDLNGNSETINGLSGGGVIDNTANSTTATLAAGDNDQSGSFTGILQNSGTSATLNFEKTGFGTIDLGGANTYSGTTAVTGGTLQVSNLSALGTTSGVSLADGTAFVPDLDGFTTSAPFTLGTVGTTSTISVPINGPGSGATITMTLNGPISGDGDLVFSDFSSGGNNTRGTIVLGAASTYTGNTTIDTSGLLGNHTIVKSGITNALPATTVLSLEGAAGQGSGRSVTFDLNGFDQTLAGLDNVSQNLRDQIVTSSNGAATLTLNNTSDFTFGGSRAQIEGPVSLVKSGAGIFSLSGTNTNTGNTTINEGELRIGDGGTLGALNPATDITIASGATFGVNRSNTAVQGTDFSTNPITGDGNFAKLGAGATTLNVANTYAGTTTVDAGALVVAHASALGTTAAGTVVNGSSSGGSANARLDLSGGVTVTGEALTISGAGNFIGALTSSSGSNVWAGPVTIAASGTRLGASAGASLEVSGLVDSGAVETGLLIRSTDLTGPVILSGANTYLGTTQVVIGKLQLAGGDNRLPVGTNLLMTCSASNPGAELDLNGTNQEVAGLEISGSADPTKNSVNNSSGTPSTLTVNTPAATPSTFAGILTGNLAITKTGPDTLSLTGTSNVYSGNTTVNEGTLSLGGINTGNDSSTVTIAASGATLDLNFAGTDTVDKLFIGAVQQPAGIYGPSATSLVQITGTGTLTVTSGPGGSGYASWALLNGAGANLDDDHDDDGVSNGVEYFIGGPNGNTTGFTALPGVDNNAGTLSVTFTKAGDYAGVYGADYVVETSATLALGSWVAAAQGAGAGQVDITGNDVKYTFPAGTKNFARLKVTGP